MTANDLRAALVAALPALLLLILMTAGRVVEVLGLNVGADLPPATRTFFVHSRICSCCSGPELVPTAELGLLLAGVQPDNSRLLDHYERP